MNFKKSKLDEQLFAACSQGNLDAVEKCLKKGANMNKVCSNGRTTLGVAAESGNIDILNLLLRNRLDKIATGSTSISSQTNSNLGYFVVVHNEADNSSLEHTDSAQNFMSRGINFDDFNNPLIQRIPGAVDRETIGDAIVLTPDGMDNLEWDTEMNDDDRCMEVNDDPWSSLYLWYANILAQTGALLAEEVPVDNVDCRDQFGCTALHYAAAEGHKDAIHILIQSGCNVNVGDSENLTPLHLAASKECVEIVELLLAKGANPHHKSADGITALHVSASRGLLNNVRALVASGANVNATDLSDRTPLYLAVSRSQHAVVKFLIEKGAKVNLEEVHGYTPIFEAIYAKDVELVETLLAAGAKLTQSHHLLHYAVMQRQEQMARVLVHAGAIINLRNDGGDTPLMLAVRTQSSSIVRLLLENGASVYCMNYSAKMTAVRYAICYMNRDCESFCEMLSIFEEFGWDWFQEKEALCYAVTTSNEHAVIALVREWDIVCDENIPKILQLLLVKENQYLFELFIRAGTRVYAVTQRLLYPWLHQLIRNPLSLQDLARIKIRSSLKRNIGQKLSELPLPRVLKDLVTFQDFPCPCKSNKDLPDYVEFYADR